LLSADFNSGKLISNEELIEGDLSNPRDAGKSEEFIFNLTDIPTDNDLLL